MKVKRTINKEIEVSIKGITLLSTEEAENLPDHLRHYSHWWWLRSPCDYAYRAASVDFGGCIDDFGDSVYDNFNAVRPALIYQSKKLKIGDNIVFGGKEWEVIDERYAFCTSDIGKHNFDEVNNNYKTSEIKKYIEDWLKKTIEVIGE